MKVKMKIRVAEAEQFDASEAEASVAKIMQCCSCDEFIQSARVVNDELQIDRIHRDTGKSSRKYAKHGEWIVNISGKVEVFTLEEFERIFYLPDESDLKND